MADNDLPDNPENRKPVVFEKGGEIFASSRDVADFFDKQHRHVLDAVDRLLSDAEEAMPHFRQGFYTLSSTGSQQHRCFEMTRDGFTLLAMSFTGSKALKWKLRYIEAFNAMESALKKVPEKTPYSWMREVVDDMERHDKRLFSVEKKVEALGAHEDYQSIKAYAALNGFRLSKQQSGDLGRAATSLSRQSSQKIGTQPDETYGKVNTYHRSVLEKIFEGLKYLAQTTEY